MMLKKVAVWWLILMLCLSAAVAEGALTALWDRNGEETKFTLTQEGGINTLHCYQLEDGRWVESFQTNAAVPQGKNQMRLYLTDSATFFTAGGEREYLPGPILLVMRYGEDGESVMLMQAFQRSDAGVWNLIALRNYEENAVINVGAETLTYHAPADKGRTIVAGTRSCTFDRNLRFFRLEDVPLTPDE